MMYSGTWEFSIFVELITRSPRSIHATPCLAPHTIKNTPLEPAVINRWHAASSEDERAFRNNRRVAVQND